MIVFSGVTKEYDGAAVLSDVSFEIAPGEFVCITGPSGAGKSTIVNLLIRADFPTKGTITVDGANIALFPIPILQVYRRRTGVVFQDYKLLPDRTVYENVAFALEVSDETDAVIAERIPQILSDLRLLDRSDAFPHELSGGERARTALARALVRSPGILIADEPTGSIDPVQAKEVMAMFKAINATGTTVILATHDEHLVDPIGTRIIHLTAGRVVSDSRMSAVVASPMQEEPVSATSKDERKGPRRAHVKLMPEE